MHRRNLILKSKPLHESEEMTIYGIKKMTWLGILALFVAVGILPLIKEVFPQVFFSLEGFRNDTSCRDSRMVCPEGSFCQEKQCIPIATRYPNNVPNGNL